MTKAFDQHSKVQCLGVGGAPEPPSGSGDKKSMLINPLFKSDKPQCPVCWKNYFMEKIGEFWRCNNCGWSDVPKDLPTPLVDKLLSL